MANLEIVNTPDPDTPDTENLTEETKNANPNVINPMNFMSPEEAAAEDAKAEAFFKALRFGCTNFFVKLKEVFEVEGIEGINRLERSLDTYFVIRRAVTEELIAANPTIVTEEELKEKRDQLEKFEPTADTNADAEEASDEDEAKSAESDWENPAEADFDADESDVDCGKSTLDPAISDADE